MTSSTPATTAPGVTFADLGLPPLLVQALRRDGIEAPFPIQAATATDCLAGKDVLGRGPTGSGKTLAFGLPMLTLLAGAQSKPGKPRGLVLVPTRELATQIEKALDNLAVALGLRVAAVVGGAPIKRQADRLARGVDLLIATPGRLEDLIKQRSADLSDVRITALDEADHMADMGFLPQVTKLLDRTPKIGQRLLFSATLDSEVDKLVKRYLNSPVTHSTAPASASVSTMTHHLLYLRKQDKRDITAQIAARDGLTIMFVRTKHGADRLAKQLRGVGVDAGSLHGGKAQNNRVRTLAAFADGKTPVLVTTDVAARGIHIDGISLVVHVDPPGESKAYLHRAGRTARAGEDGVVVTLVTDEERGEVLKMTRKAGVEIDGVEVRPGSRRLNDVTGAKQPSGVPLVAAVSAQHGDEDDRGGARRRTGGSARRTGGGAGGGRGGPAGSRGGATRTSSRGSGSTQAAPGRATSSAKPATARTGAPAAAPRTAGAGAPARGTGSAKAAPVRTAAGHSAAYAGTSTGRSGTDTPGRQRRRAGRPQGTTGIRNHGAN